MGRNADATCTTPAERRRFRVASSWYTHGSCQGFVNPTPVKRPFPRSKESDWQPFKTSDDLATERKIAETVHCVTETEQAFRLVVLSWQNPQPSLFHLVANKLRGACQRDNLVASRAG